MIEGFVEIGLKEFLERHLPDIKFSRMAVVQMATAALKQGADLPFIIEDQYRYLITKGSIDAYLNPGARKPEAASSPLPEGSAPAKGKAEPKEAKA